ncbi:olfactory receptor 51G2-like [Ambystoma mexicanum]|uniref:olfactory receptor 51G2-like n=1 Tax=Ambystoma mexicanum TaxID=8296 RepID=UPI0037E77E61
MAALNATIIPWSSLLLKGIPGAEDAHIWISIPLVILSLLSVLGNGLILLIIKTHNQFDDPMYRFLAMLALSDLGLTISTSPTILGMFWFNARDVNFDLCLTQMFFFQSFSSLESSILVLMAFDRFVAICYPLRYMSVLTNPSIFKMGVMAVLRSTCLHVPEPILLKRLRYCHNNVLSHAFCFHPDLIRLACSDTTINSIYGLVLVLSTFLLDSLLIIFSYVMILRAVLRLNSLEKRVKTFSTCVSHGCVVLISYIPLIGLTVVHRFGKDASPLIHVLMGITYVFLPPALNPIVYSLKHSKIKEVLLKHLLVTT